MSEEKPNRTKHRAIYTYLHAAILDGRFRLGQRIPSEVQLSRKFQTTRVTVAKALRELEYAGYLERRPGSGSYVRLPGQTKSRSFGLLVASLGDGEIFEPICTAIVAAMRARQFAIVWGDASSPLPSPPADKCRQAEALCRQFIEQRVDGVFFHPVEFAPGMNEVNREILELLDRERIPVVLLDCDAVRYPQRSRYDIVGIDNRRAGYVLARHLLDRGAQRIDFVSRPLSSPTIESRVAGYQEALWQGGITPRPSWVHCGEVADLEFVRTLVGRRPPDAFVCGNDYTAACLMQNLQRLKITVPDDVLVVGVDDLKYARLLSVPLTTIHQPCPALGEAAVDAMLRRLENPTMPAHDICVDFHLVVRRSSGVEETATEMLETDSLFAPVPVE